MGKPPLPRARMRRLKGGTRYLGRYELIGQLAKGGMGTVFLARHAGQAGFRRLFAVKMLHEHLADEPGFVDMLRDEGRLAARIHHPNCVGVVDLGNQEDYHYIVMDYVEGPTFATLVKRSAGTAPVAQCIAVVLDALEGLHAAHTLKDDDGNPIHLVHRDVSPQNILVGVDGLAKITDFGIAKAESRIASTQPGTRKGKLEFMSPEQFQNPDKIDRRTDIWAIGVVLWDVLTGKSLFRGETQPETIHNLTSKHVPPPSEASSRCPACLDSVILKALEREPEKRYETAREMAGALRSVAARNNLLGSRHSVAEWVEQAFKGELEDRRAAIRVVTARNDGLEDSRVTSLPSLPPMVATPSSLSGADEIAPEDGDTASITSSLPDEGMESSPPFRSPHRRLVMGATMVLAAGAIGLLALLSGSPERATSDAAEKELPATAPAVATSDERVEPVPSTSPTDTAPESSSEAEAEAEESDPTEQSEQSADETRSAKNTAAAPRTARPSRAARTVKPRPRSRTATRKPTSAGTSKPDKAPKPSTRPSPVELENNPYLRR